MEKKKEELSKEDLKLLSQLIELCSKNGLFTGKDLSMAGKLYDKVVKLWQ